MAVRIHTCLWPGRSDPSCEHEYSQKVYWQLNVKDWLQLSLRFEHRFCFIASLSKLICPSPVILPSGPRLTAFSLYSGYMPIDLSKSCARIKIEWGPRDSGWISWIPFRYDFLYKDPHFSLNNREEEDDNSFSDMIQNNHFSNVCVRWKTGNEPFEKKYSLRNMLGVVNG